MIGKLAGRIDYKADDHILLDVKGVGYIVYCSDRTLAALPNPGQAIVLYTDLLVREDLMQLFGFLSLVEKEWHRLLMSVQGIGAKASLAILGALGPDGVSRAIALGDWNAVKAAKGVGPKTAQRVVLDLKDKAPSVMSMSSTQQSAPLVQNRNPDDDVIDTIDTFSPTPPVTAKPVPAIGASQADALSALTNLGYSPSEAASAIATVLGESGVDDTATLIRSSLKLLAPKG